MLRQLGPSNRIKLRDGGRNDRVEFLGNAAWAQKTGAVGTIDVSNRPRNRNTKRRGVAKPLGSDDDLN